MTHGHEKSDSAIVAVKPANKADTLLRSNPRRSDRGGAGGAKGGDQGECGPAKHVPDAGPESVSQALDRIRRVAKERKKEKLTALLHHISIDLLEEAFFELKEECRCRA